MARPCTAAAAAGGGVAAAPAAAAAVAGGGVAAAAVLAAAVAAGNLFNKACFLGEWSQPNRAWVHDQLLRQLLKGAQCAARHLHQPDDKCQ